MPALGDLPVDGTAYCEFDTFDSSGGSVTITGLAITDVEIYRDGGTTARASDNGYALIDTDGIDVNGHAGCHGFSVDLSDNSDAGFYVTGSHFRAIVDAITVDGQTVRFSFTWTIGRLLRPTTTGRTLDVAATGEAGVDLGNVTGTLTQANVGWVDANSRVDVGSWLGTAVTTSTTTAKPEVDAFSISDSEPAAGMVENNIGNLNASVISRSTVTASQVNTQVDAALSDWGKTGFSLAATGLDLVTAWTTNITGSLSGSVGSVTGNVGGNVAGSVGSVTANVTTDVASRTASQADVSALALEATVGTHDTDIKGLLPAALVSGRMSSDAVAISGSTDAADKLEASAEMIQIGAAEAGTLSTTQMTTNLTEATDDHYNGRVIIWTSGVLLRQATDITDYAGTNGLLTFTAVTEAPSAGDTFFIV